MTINAADNSPRIEYAVAQGVTQTTFSVPFEFFDTGDLNVYVDGVLKVEGSDYTVTGGEGSTGSIIFVDADPGEVQQVTGATGGSQVVITRDIPIERTTDFNAGSDINRAALNEQLDTIIALIADVDDKASRAIQIPDYEVAPSLSLADINDRKGKVLAFNATTGAVGVGPTSYDIGVIADNIAAILDADDQAAAAAASATAAASSESNAASSEGAVASSASAAATSETNAASSASSASGSATAAASSASGAADSATAAASSASAAASSASAASTSASNAAASEAAAAASYDNFDDRYLGAKASDPTTDNDGDALVTGALYFNTTDNSMKVYDGSQWLAAYASLSGALIAVNNLSDISDAAAARTNLGLGSAATTDSTAYATAAQGTNADTAYGWGNHASAGYLTDITGESIQDLSDVSAMTPAEGQALVYSSGSWTAADMSGGIAYIRKTANYTASANEGIIADTSGGAFTVTLPASPATGDTVMVVDGNDWSTTNLIVGRNGSTIEGDASDLTCDVGAVAIQFTYDGTTWQIYTQAGSFGANLSDYLPLSGGTLTGALSGTSLTLTGAANFGAEIVETTYNLTGTALDPTNGTIQYKTLSANTTFIDDLDAGQSMTLMIDDGTAYTITWPTMQWAGGSAPTLATSGYSVVVLWKVGTTLYGTYIGDMA